MKVKVTQSCPTLRPHGLDSPWNSAGQTIGVGSISLLQGIFPTQGLNRRLLHCRQILYQLSYQGSPVYMKCLLNGPVWTKASPYLKMAKMCNINLLDFELLAKKLKSWSIHSQG